MDGTRLVRVADRVRVPWKNGRGVTEEIAIGPDGATVSSGFDWRLSIASVDEDGPFSLFPGVDRTLVVLQGEGLELEGLDRPVPLDHRFALASFPGDAAVTARLRDGRVRDLNLMTRRATCTHTAEVRRADGPVELSGAPALVVVLDGRVVVGRKRVLGSGDALIADAPVTLQAAGTLFVARIERQAASE